MEEFWNNVVDSGARARTAGLESALELTRLATRTQGLLMRQQLIALEHCLEAGARQWALVGSAAEPAELFAAQADTLRSLGDGLSGVARESYAIGAQARDELAHWAEQGLGAVQALVPAADEAPIVAKTPVAAKAPARPRAKKKVATTRAKAAPRRRAARTATH